MDRSRPSTCDGVKEPDRRMSTMAMSMSPPLSHQRSLSDRKTKRFSLTFPIQTTTSPLSSAPSPVLPYTPCVIDTPPTAPAGPTDSAFLTALAAHERRVLELREELAKAEQELRRLKQTWAAHEAHKKRHDARKVHKMQPLAHDLLVDTSTPSSTQQNDMERRRALLNGNRTSNRTVFSGSRHARTLSLLNPEMKSQTFRDPHHAPTSVSTPGPDPSPGASAGPVPGTDSDLMRPPPPPRVLTDADLTSEVDRTVDDNIDLGLPREVLLKTGKQMATDFRDGLWTFIEDLRQATVGDEAINGTTSRTLSAQPSLRPQPSRGSLKPPTKPQPPPLKRSATTGSRRTTSRSPALTTAEDVAYLDIGNSFWKENGLEEPKEASPPILRKPSKRTVRPSQKPNRASTTSLDGWDSWDAHMPDQKATRSNSGSSASEVRTSPSPDGTSPRTSTSSFRDSKRDSLPWPALTKLAPSNLRRTASHLMSEWEKSLTPSPSPGERDRSDYMGRASSPAGSVKDTKND